MARTVYTEKRGEPVLKKLLQVNCFSHTTATYKIIFTLELKQYYEQLVNLDWKDLDYPFIFQSITLMSNVMLKSRYHKIK